MKVIQCWDDGVTSDILLVDILRKYDAQATFNLNAGLHQSIRSNGWKYKNTEVVRLSQNEIVDVYEGFTIANHSLTHPHLETLPLDEVRVEVEENRKRLQDLFGQSIDGFAYPFGTYNNSIVDIIEQQGHKYARTIKNSVPAFPPQNPYEFHPSCHFLAKDFWVRYQESKQSGVFYFWGHSYEMISKMMWIDFENKIKKINEDPESQWYDISKLFP